MLRERFAEVSRSAMTSSRASLIDSDQERRFGRTAKQQFRADFKEENGVKTLGRDFLNLVVSTPRKASRRGRRPAEQGLFRAGRAQLSPNGRASFLAGGESDPYR